MLFNETFEWVIDKFKDYNIYSQYDPKVNFGNAVIKLGTDEIMIYGVNNIIKGTINKRELKDVKKELREFYNAKHN